MYNDLVRKLEKLRRELDCFPDAVNTVDQAIQAIDDMSKTIVRMLEEKREDLKNEISRIEREIKNEQIEQFCKNRGGWYRL